MRWREKTLLIQHLAYKPIGRRTFSCYVETCQKHTARFQYPEILRKSFRFVGKNMKTVHRQHTVETVALERQIAHIAPNKFQIAQFRFGHSELRNVEHLLRIIQSDDLGVVPL